MLLRSTNGKSAVVSFREATLQGLAPDGGLYMPVSFPRIPDDLLVRMPQFDFRALSHRLACNWIGDEIPPALLETMIYDAFDFEVPLVGLDSRLWVLELFHGPTLAFKDFGARFMARLLAHFNEGAPEVTILVATSGDTGSAVASGFFGVPGIRVVVLYPSGRVSQIQEQQMATLGGNISTLEVQGSFDDCQRLVKQAFQDTELRTKRRLTSANSINIARLLPQSFYYCYAWSRLGTAGTQVVFSVPSGNFGNLTAGLLAHRAGLPVSGFIAATNCNDVVPEYLKTGIFHPRSSIETISNAMDVGNPSNFARMLSLYDSDKDKMRADITACAFSDEQTRDAMRDVYRKTGYILDPHGAVAYLGATQNQRPNCEVISLETAHPAKFCDIVEPVLGLKVELPNVLQSCLTLPKVSIPISSEFPALKSWLLS